MESRSTRRNDVTPLIHAITVLIYLFLFGVSSYYCGIFTVKDSTVKSVHTVVRDLPAYLLIV